MIDLKKWGITMTNGEVQNIENPDTFQIPNECWRMNLMVDTFVKIIFNMPDGAERMWVKVVERLEERGMYIGALGNVPFQSSEFGLGDEFFFHAKHIIDIFEERIPWAGCLKK